MKANELRVGNLVYPFINSAEVGEEEVIEILEIGEHCKVKWEDDIMYRYIEDLSPIPLTEEILLKCGFEKLKGKKNENTFMNADLNFGNPVLKLNDYTRLCTNGGYEYLFLDGFRLPCKYLHQLQNLYFALTGNELTIKEN